MIDKEEIENNMFEATMEIKKAIKKLPTIISIALLDTIKTDIMLNFHIKQDGIIGPLSKKKNK